MEELPHGFARDLSTRTIDPHHVKVGFGGFKWIVD
jgi:hypothetical protein